MKKLSKFVIPIVLMMLVLAPVVVDAQGIFGDPTVSKPSQFEGSQTATQLIVKILNVVLAIVGLIAVLFLVWGGFKYITSAGDEEKVKEAKQTIINSLIGVAVVILAFALVRIVANAIGGRT